MVMSKFVRALVVLAVMAAMTSQPSSAEIHEDSEEGEVEEEEEGFDDDLSVEFTKEALSEFQSCLCDGSFLECRAVFGSGDFAWTVQTIHRNGSFTGKSQFCRFYVCDFSRSGEELVCSQLEQQFVCKLGLPSWVLPAREPCCGPACMRLLWAKPDEALPFEPLPEPEECDAACSCLEEETAIGRATHVATLDNIAETTTTATTTGSPTNVVSTNTTEELTTTTTQPGGLASTTSHELTNRTEHLSAADSGDITGTIIPVIVAVVIVIVAVVIVIGIVLLRKRRQNRNHSYTQNGNLRNPDEEMPELVPINQIYKPSLVAKNGNGCAFVDGHHDHDVESASGRNNSSSRGRPSDNPLQSLLVPADA